MGFPRATLDAIRSSKYLWIRAGEGHRFVAIWSVVAGHRLFIRAYNLKRGGWPQAFDEVKRGAIKVAKDADEIAIRARRVRSERLKTLVDEGFAEKYTTPSNLKYVKGFRAKRRRDATFELTPA